MKLEHSFQVPVGVDEAWKILLDIERIGPCMPGASIDSVDGDDFTGSVKVKLGAINLTYKGKASFVEKDEAAHRAVIDARGRDSRGNGTAAAKVTAVLTEEAGGTKVVVDTDLDVTGKVAQFGRGVMVDVGNKLIGQFADCLASTITAGEETAADSSAESGSAAPTPPTEATSAAPATQVIEEQALQAVAEAPGYSAPSTGGEDATAGGEDATASSQDTAQTPAPSVNGHSTATPQREVAPINLLEHAGPAVAKRLAPPLAGLLVVLVFVLIRRRRG